MAEVPTTPENALGRDDLELEKLQHENKKLRLENEKLEHPWYRPKPSWIVVIASVAGVVALYAQNYLTSIKTARELLRDEREKQSLEREIQELQGKLTTMRAEQGRLAVEKGDVTAIFEVADRRATRLREEYERVRTQLQGNNPGAVESLDRAIKDLEGMLSMRSGLNRGHQQTELAHKRLQAASSVSDRPDVTRGDLESAIADLEQSRQDLETVLLIYRALRTKAPPGPERDALTDPEESTKILIQALTEESLSLQLSLKQGRYRK